MGAAIFSMYLTIPIRDDDRDDDDHVHRDDDNDRNDDNVTNYGDEKTTTIM